MTGPMQDHPFLLNIRTILVYNLVWVFIALAWFFIELSNYPGKPGMAFTDALIFNALFSVLALGLYNAVRFFNFEEKSIWTVLAQHLMGLAITLIVWLLAAYLLVIIVDRKDWQYENFFIRTLPWRAAIGVFYYSTVVLLYYLIIYYQNFRETITREAELKALVKEAELSMLRSQINPHFLFNSLNSISSLTITDPAKAQEMLIKLSEFLRYSLGESEKQMVSLKAELDYVRLYLDIEKIRFGQKLVHEWNVNEKCLQAKLPNMILQPLYENAIKHGVYESPDEIRIVTSCSADDHRLLITIRNNYNTDAVSRKGKGLGLKNIASRLKLIYHQDDLISTEKKNGIFEVRLIIPQ